jgi:hypothetical protein
MATGTKPMKKKQTSTSKISFMRHYLIIPLLCFLCMSCLSTIHPFISNDPSESLPIKKELLGRWQMDSVTVNFEPYLSSSLRMDEPNVTETMAQKTKKTEEQLLDSVAFTKQYLASYTRNGIVYVLECAITQINGELYIEFLPYNISTLSNDVAPDSYNFQNTFTIARLHIGHNEARLEFLDGYFIRKQIEAGNMKIKYEHERIFDVFTVTAATAELRAFLAKYGNDGRLYQKENMISLIRKS